MLRDHILRSTNDEACNGDCWKFWTLTFNIARKTVIAMEVASKDSRVLSTPNYSSLVLPHAVSHYTAVKQKRRNQDALSCVHCRGKHSTTQCRHASIICHTCRGKGYLSRVCKGKTVDTNAGGHVTPTRRQRPVYRLYEADHLQEISTREVL